MRANQRLVGDDGYEVMLFPLEYMNASQQEGGGYSHAGTYQMDFLGWGANGRVLNCPYYAPCTCRCVAITDAAANNRVYESINKVHLADGTLGYVTFETAHDNFPVTTVGTVLTQGQLMGHTGTAGNVTGDHLHFQCGRGTYQGWVQLPNGNWMLANEMHIYDACYVNDTTIIQGYGYNWREYQGGVEPTPEEEQKRRGYKWQVFTRRIRNSRRLIKWNYPKLLIQFKRNLEKKNLEKLQMILQIFWFLKKPIQKQ